MATVCAMSLGLAACSKPAEQAKTDTASAPAASVATGKKIRIATEGAYKPFNFTNADGSLSGYDVDVVKAACAQMKADCEVIAQDWDGILPGLMAKKYDAIAAGMSITQSVLPKLTLPNLTSKIPWYGSLPKTVNSAHKTQPV